MLKIRNISKSYIQRGLVLDNLNLEIKESCSLAITGPSGSGKTTLLNIIGMLTKPDKGEVFFNGHDITKLDADSAAFYRNRKIGFIFQDHLLLPHLTIFENIMLPLLANKESRKSSEDASKYAISLMDKTGIIDLKNKFPGQVSGGEAQRATLVRALINKPDLILADEPTGSLDSDNAELMATILVELNKELGTTLIVVTHSDSLASKMQKRMQIDKGVLKLA
ncbi:MAG: ABC transporter ATP-binding protein [Bacteroidales bacterium]|jgi:lipoprotein-releasing system ATP-binding protein|nr:ABC transporter ATP-binding protein [Bacteroidales bacterium]